jgi:hypothetical protein
MRGMLDGGYFVFPRNVFSSRLGTHRVDAVLTGRIPAGKEKLEIRPPAEANDGRIRHITVGRGDTIPIPPELLR